MSWRVAKPCADCPFSDSPGGKRQREALAPGRMAAIKKSLRGRDAAAFYCHKTTRETGNGKNLVCAGALAWQEQNGGSSNYQRCCEAIDYFARRRAEREGVKA